MILTCPCCIGRKNILGLGNIRKECDNCFGIGHVDAPVLESVAEPVVRENRIAAEKPTVRENRTVAKEKPITRIHKDGSPKRAYNRKVKVG